MKKLLAILALAGAVALAWTCNQDKKEKDPDIYNRFCNGSPADNLCPHIPYDVNESFTLGYDSFLDSLHQIPFDVFSWQTFVALNWPSDSAGNPVGNSPSDFPDAPRVWERYTDPATIFGHTNTELLLQLGDAGRNGQKFFYMDSKAPVSLLPNNTIDMSLLTHNKLKGFLEADGHPLIDRNLNFVLYEIKLNPVETKYIVSNKLTTVQGIYSYAATSPGGIELPASDSASGNPGIIEIKSSWRILVPALGDDTSRYYCRRATVYIDSLHTRNRKSLILTNVQVGLVGMHIVRKTAKVSANQIWTTFEHIDNVPDNPQQAQQNNKQWSFYNAACLNCPPNTPPDTLTGDQGRYIWETTMPYAGSYAVKPPGQTPDDSFGVQAVRVYPIYKYTEMVTQLWQNKLKGTVWANYRLIGTQWQQAEISPAPTAPNFLANTTLETYDQISASCISCHGGASVIYNNDTIRTDLSFIFPVYAK
ncbi:MAG: hypothetical protein ABW019_06495 [Chitinophagaceae bacterium]